MGLLNKTEAGMDYCISCGNAIVHGRCSKCGREAKHMVDFNGFAFRQMWQTHWDNRRKSCSRAMRSWRYRR